MRTKNRPQWLCSFHVCIVVGNLNFEIVDSYPIADVDVGPIYFYVRFFSCTL
jgi:hypothetical protein